MVEKRGHTEEEALACLRRNNVNIEKKYSGKQDENGSLLVAARIIKPERAPGLKVLRMIDCLVNWHPTRKYRFYPAA